MDSDGVVVRPMVEDDVVAAQAMAYETMRQAGIAYAMPVPEATPESRARGQARARHGIEHDPETSLVAVQDGRVVGVALAERRGPLWFLALLAVESSAQSRGIGRRLVDAAMVTFGEAGLICASDDPKALRRYRLAGFDLLPCLEAKGPLDRSLIPVTGVREGSFEDDRELVESVATSLRGAPYGVDLALCPTVPPAVRGRDSHWARLPAVGQDGPGRAGGHRSRRPPPTCCGPRWPRPRTTSRPSPGSRPGSNGPSMLRSPPGCRCGRRDAWRYEARSAR